MIEVKDADIFGKVIADSIAVVDDNQSLQTWEKTRYINAIAKAAARMQDPAFAYWMEFNGDADEMLIWNSVSNCIYTIAADGTCQCMAAQNGYFCWHRAAKRLYELYLNATIEAKFGPVTIIRTDCQVREVEAMEVAVA